MQTAIIIPSRCDIVYECHNAQLLHRV